MLIYTAYAKNLTARLIKFDICGENPEIALAHIKSIILSIFVNVFRKG